MTAKPNRHLLTAGIVTLLITLAVLATALATTMASGDDPLAITGLQSREVPENATTVGSYTTNAPETATVTWSLEGTDGDLLSVGAGNLTFLAPPDYESPADDDSDNVYEVTLNANTSEPEAQSVSLDVRITVQDVNEPPSPATAPMTFKLLPSATTYADMNTWFNDPEGDTLEISVSTPTDSNLKAEVMGTYLKLNTLDEEGKTIVTVTASDGHARTGARDKPTVTATANVVRDSSPPSEPRNLQATRAQNRLDLTWDPPADTGGASIYAHVIDYRVAGTDDPFTSIVYQSSFPAYILGGLEESTTYEIKVLACNRRRAFSFFVVRCGSYATITATTLGAMLEFTHAEYFPQFYIHALSASTLPYASTDDVDNPPGVTYSITGLSTLIALADDVAFDDTTRILSGKPHSPGTAVLALTATAAGGQTASTTITINVQNKLAPPTGLDIVPAPGEPYTKADTQKNEIQFPTRIAELTWEPSINKTNSTVYDVYIQEEEQAPRKITDEVGISTPSMSICLDNAGCRDEASAQTKGLRKHDYIDVWVIARESPLQIPRSNVIPLPSSLADSEQSETVRIVPSPITTIDGNANEHGEGTVEVRWIQAENTTRITIRWRQLQNDGTKEHNQYEWGLTGTSLPQFDKSDSKHLTSGSDHKTNPKRRTTPITGLQAKTPYAVQFNFTQSAGPDNPDRKVFSGTDHYVYPSDKPAGDGERIASMPLRQYLSEKEYKYAFCEDTFDEPTETWLFLIQHAFQEWAMATDGLIEARRLVETNGTPTECADYDSYIQLVTDEAVETIYSAEEYPRPLPTTEELKQHVAQIIEALENTDLKSNRNKDKELNEIRMLNDARYQRFLPQLEFIQVAEASGINTKCLGSGDFNACAIPTSTKELRIFPEIHRSTDIHIVRSRVQPLPEAALTAAHFPGGDIVRNEEDVKFNYCTDSAFNLTKSPANTYETLMHEIGHALGIHDSIEYTTDQPLEQSGHHPNPSIANTLMRHKTTPAQTCSPHPLDIMALYAIYQTKE